MIVSAGEALMDLTPEPRPGGGPYNAAIAAARLGAPVAFLGRISNDPFGERLLAHLVANGVDVSLVERGPEPTATAEVDPGPPLRFTFHGDNTADAALSQADFGPLGKAPTILHGGTLGLFRGRTAKVLAVAAERFDGLVSLDPNARPRIIDDRAVWMHFHDRWLAHAGVYKASDEDLEWIFPGREPASVAAELVDGGVALVTVTEGPDGATFYTSQGDVSVPGYPVEVGDTVGAGDTFIASVLTDLWREGGDVSQADIRAVGTRAVKAAAWTCSRIGADPPTAEELETW